MRFEMDPIALDESMHRNHRFERQTVVERNLLRHVTWNLDDTDLLPEQLTVGIGLLDVKIGYFSSRKFSKF